MFRVIKVTERDGVIYDLESLENLLNLGWKIHDKTATHDAVIYILWMAPAQSSGPNH